VENTDNINKAAVELKDGCNAHGRSKIKLIGISTIAPAIKEPAAGTKGDKP
jgi:hypothetical protein